MCKQTLFKWQGTSKQWGPEYVDTDSIIFAIESILPGEEWLEVYQAEDSNEGGIRIGGAENIAEVKRLLDARVAPKEETEADAPAEWTQETWDREEVLKAAKEKYDNGLYSCMDCGLIALLTKEES